MCKKILLLVLLMFLFPSRANAYIDPGTGSMLLSVIITILASIGFFVHSTLNKIKFLFEKKDDESCKNSGKIVIYSEGKQYWSTFKPILDEFEKREHEVVYLTAKQDDPFFSEDYKYVTGNVIGEGNSAYIKLAFLEADICLMTTPNLEVYQLKRSKKVKHYSHILHSTCCITLYQLFAFDYFDSILTNGQYQEKYVRELEKNRGLKAKDIKVIGCSYLDYLNNKLKNLKVEKNDKFSVLVAPSWGENGLLQLFGTKLLDKIVQKQDWQIILRPHPQSYKSEAKLIEKLKNKYADAKNLVWDSESDNIVSMSKADILISDFSGIIYDWMFLFNKPFIYSNKNFNLDVYDACDVKDAVWDFEVMKKVGAELCKDNVKDICSIIEKISENKAADFEDISAQAWQNRGNSAVACVDYLIKKQEELKSC